MFAFVYQMPVISPKLRGRCKKLKHGTFAKLYLHHVRGLGVWLKPTGTLYLLGESSPELKAHASDAFLTHFIEYTLWKGSADTLPILSQGFGPIAENGFKHFTGLKCALKTRNINTINSIFLPKIKLNR